MTHNPDDIVRVADGPLVQVEIWQGVLREAGIVSQVVGTDLSAGLGTAIPGSVELWVHRSDAVRAEDVLRAAESHRGETELPPPPRGPVESDPRPAPGQPGRHPHTHYQKDPGAK